MIRKIFMQCYILSPMYLVPILKYLSLLANLQSLPNTTIEFLRMMVLSPWKLWIGKRDLNIYLYIRTNIRSRLKSIIFDIYANVPLSMKYLCIYDVHLQIIKCHGNLKVIKNKIWLLQSRNLNFIWGNSY